MKPLLIFKTAGWVLIVVAIVHLIGHFLLVASAPAEEKQLIRLMSVYEKSIAGGSMSMTDIVHGLNVCYALFLLFAGLTDLIIASHVKNLHLARKFAFVQVIIFMLGAIVSLIYFYWLPVILFIVMSFLFAASAHLAAKSTNPSS